MHQHKIGVFADVHANLSALEAVLAHLHAETCDELICLGDVPDMGPAPKECFELLIQNHVTILMGNHDAYYVNGVSDPATMGASEYANRTWTHLAMGSEHVKTMQSFPYHIQRTFGTTTATFIHYPHENGQFQNIVRPADESNLDKLFSNIKSNLILFGHDHDRCDVQGIARYVNPGSLGCTYDDTTKAVILTFTQSNYSIDFLDIPYDRQKTLDAFQTRDVPGREEILRFFYGV